MTNYEIIKQKCIEANPEIMELKFGCKIKNLHGKIETFINNAGQHKYRCISENGFFDETLKIFITEILGRDIHLADVLYAITITDSEAMAEKVAGDLTFQSINSWNLLKDSLKDQSEETLEFLANLLK